MSSRRPLAGWQSSEERRVFAVQMAIVLVIITLLSLGFYHQRQLVEIDRRHSVERVVHGWDGLAWYVWVLAAPGTLMLIRRFPVSRTRPGRSLAGLLLGSAAIYFVVANTRFLLRILPNFWLAGAPAHSWSWATYVDTQTVLLPIDFLTYCGFFATSYAIDYYFKYRQRAEEVLRLELQAAQLQSELAKARFAALRGQLHPHFLFNAFNAISTLMRQNKTNDAIEMIARLGELFRLTMETIDQPELTLENELEFTRCYLDVERARFGDKLRVELDVEDAVRGCRVPSLLLQPLVENAIKHGIARRVSAGKIRLSAVRRGDRLCLEVADDGPDGPPAQVAERSEGIGLRNTRGRLRNSYGDDCRLDITSRTGGGTLVRLDLPCRI